MTEEDDTQITVEEFEKMSVVEKVAAVKKAGRQEVAGEVLRLIDAMHGREIVVRLREYVLHEINPKKHAEARIPMYARRKITAMAPVQVEPEPEPDPDELATEEDRVAGDGDDFGDDEADAALDEAVEATDPNSERE